MGVVLKPVSDTSVAAMIDGLSCFGIGYSWGGYESLAIPANPATHRTATQWTATGPLVRLQIGLEATEDLIEDLARGLDRLGRNDIP